MAAKHLRAMAESVVSDMDARDVGVDITETDGRYVSYHHICDDTICDDTRNQAGIKEYRQRYRENTSDKKS